MSVVRTGPLVTVPEIFGKGCVEKWTGQETMAVCQLGQKSDQEITLNEKIHQVDYVLDPLVVQEIRACLFL